MNYLIYIIGALLFSAFFSGMEIAFVSANKLRIELDKKQGSYSSGIITLFSKNPTQYIATMLIGNNIALVIYGLIMAIVLEPYIAIYVQSEAWVLFFQTLISTIIILVTAEFLPKTLFQIDPNLMLNALSIPVFIFYLLFYVIAKPTVLLSNFFLKSILKTKLIDTKRHFVFGKIDLDDFIKMTNDSMKENQDVEHEVKIFQNALDFSKVKLRECTVPRTEIAAVEITDNLELLKSKFIETGYSKIIVYQDSIDNILGYASSLDLFKNPKDIKSMVNTLIIVPESMPANKLLEQFIQERKSIAVVVDEFGGTSGMVTIEDIIEEIFGEIEDEHDTIDLIDKVLDENEYLFSGRLEIDYINEKHNGLLPEKEEYETVAGLILFHHGNIPKINEIITIDNYQFHIIKVTKTRIELVKLKVIDKN